MKPNHFDKNIVPSEITPASDYLGGRRMRLPLADAVQSQERRKIVSAIFASGGLASVGV